MQEKNQKSSSSNGGALLSVFVITLSLVNLQGIYRLQWLEDLPHSRFTLQNEGASYTSIGMAIHHHKPSTALARARQLRGYRSHLYSQTQNKEANKNKNKEEKKLRFDSNNNKRKDLLTPVSPSVQA